jgi:type I restriction enzyme M protein
MPKVKSSESKSNGSTLDFEAQLWAAADKMRGHMDASEYKHVALGLIFLKYISDAFEEKREQLLFGFSNPKSEWFIKDEPQRADAAENRDEYLASNVFWLPPEARWHCINAKAKSPEIGKVIDDAMGAIERENPTLKGVLPRDYARPSLDKVQLGVADELFVLSDGKDPAVVDIAAILTLEAAQFFMARGHGNIASLGDPLQTICACCRE